MSARVEIDLNVRVRGRQTFAGLEDVRGGPVGIEDYVTVFEPETGLEGHGRVTDVDSERGLVYLAVDWASLREPSAEQPGVLASFLTASRLVRAGGATRGPGTGQGQESAVACTA